YEDLEIDVVGDADPELDASKDSGFAVPEAVLRSVTENRRKALGLEERHAAERFLQYFWSTWKEDYARGTPIKETIKSTARGGKRGGPDSYGYTAYRSLVLAMINRKGGVMSQVEDILTRIGATPADIWKDDRSLNRERPASKRVLEHQVPITDSHQRIEERDVQAALARGLFGDHAVSSRGTIVPEYIPAIRCFAQRKYENEARSLKRKVATSFSRMQKVDAKLQEAQELKSPAALRGATSALAEWRRTATETKEVDDLHFHSRETLLKQLWLSLGFGNSEEAGKTSKPKVKSAQGAPTEAEMQAAYAYYLEEYCHGIGSLDESELPVLESGIAGLHNLAEGSHDIGVAHLMSFSAEHLWNILGLPGANQFPFAEPGANNTLNSSTSQHKTRAVPFWHQLVGTLKILEGAFTQRTGTRAQPALLCDNVGLGKTVQIIGVISMLEHYYKQQELPVEQRLAPPAFTKDNGTPYFGGEKSIPNLPSIVIAPRTLGNQWVEQWNKFTQLGSFVVIRYTVDNGPLETFFSDPKGPYKTAAGQNLEHAGRVIIIADLSAISKEAKRCLQPPPELKGKDAKEHEAKGEAPALKIGVNAAGSLFGMRFRVAAIDEIHNLRNSSHSQRGVQFISESSCLVIGATATPLFTALKCLFALARNLRYQPLLGDKGLQVWNEVQEMLVDGSENWRLNSKAIVEATIEKEVKEVLSLAKISSQDPRATKIKDDIRAKYENEDQRSILRMIHLSKQPVNILRLILYPIMIRRTSESLDFAGKRILDLPFVQKFIAWSPMNEEEKEMQHLINQEHTRRKTTKKKQANKQRAKKKGKQMQETASEEQEEQDGLDSEGQVERNDCKNIRWHNFLIDQKFAGMLAKLGELRFKEESLELERGTLTNHITDNWTAENLHQMISTRMECVYNLVMWFWDGNPPPMVLLEDGTMFTLKGRGFVSYDGSMATNHRQQSVEKFTNDPNCRIMIISNVGSAGLNLVQASVVIIVSSVWSGLELNQIMGRVDRPGQERDTVVYNIMAPEGIDLALNVYADNVYTNIANPHSDSQDESDSEGNDLVDSGHTVIASESKVGSRKRKNNSSTDTKDASQAPKRTKVKTSTSNLGHRTTPVTAADPAPEQTKTVTPDSGLTGNSLSAMPHAIDNLPNNDSCVDALLPPQGSSVKSGTTAQGQTTLGSIQAKIRLASSSVDQSVRNVAAKDCSAEQSYSQQVTTVVQSRTRDDVLPQGIPSLTENKLLGSESATVGLPDQTVSSKPSGALLEPLSQQQGPSSSAVGQAQLAPTPLSGVSVQKKVFSLKASRLLANRHLVNGKK
ncbi:helicase, partial [Rhizoctonia solani]